MNDANIRESMSRRKFIGASAGMALLGAAGGCASDAAGAGFRQERPLVLGQIGLSFHVASAAVVRQLLEKDGVRTATREAPHEKMYEMLGKGEVDMVASAWLPGSHGAYIKNYEDQLLKLGILYEPYTIWGVPDYVPESAVREVADLLKPEVAARMTKRIQGIGAGAGISRFSREIVQAYRLDLAGYEFHNGTLQDCVATYEAAVAEQRWVVVPLWHPQFLHNTYKIRELVEPKGLLRGRDQATLVIRRDAANLMPARTLGTLQRMALGNAAVTEVDYLINVKGMPAMEAATDWMARHRSQVDRWSV